MVSESEQEEPNIPPILVALEVSKLERSRDVKEEQPENIPSNDSAFIVLKFERSRRSSEEHLANILLKV